MSRSPSKPDSHSSEKAERPLCFVVGPIGNRGSEINKRANWLLKGLLKPVLEADEFGYRVKRADEDASPGSIASAVIIDVLNADLVIADLTGFNPNAFYEIGLRHMTGKPTIHVIAEMVDLPFDNQDQRTLFVDLTDIDEMEASKVALANMIRAVQSTGYKVSNPVTQANGLLALTQSGDTKDQLFLDMEQRLALVERATETMNQKAERQPVIGIRRTVDGVSWKRSLSSHAMQVPSSMTGPIELRPADARLLRDLASANELDAAELEAFQKYQSGRDLTQFEVSRLEAKLSSLS